MIEYIKEEFDNIVYSLDFGFEEPDKLNLDWIDFLESVDWNKNYIDNRFNMVVKEIRRYTDMWNNDKEEVHNIFSQKNILEKRKHNQNLILYHNPVLTELHDKLLKVVKDD
jgi:argonaute-like protein implicated in RNA metabolism and viral defense